MQKSMTKGILLLLSVTLTCIPVYAKKYKWEYRSSAPQVTTVSQGQGGKQIVKAWAVAGNADKAIVKAKMDAVNAALFYGIGADESTHGMGVANLSSPLVTDAQYQDNKKLFEEFFKKGEFLNYVNEVNSSYPTGENNMSVPGGRKVGLNLVIDYPGLRKWLENNGISKGLGGHFN